VQLIATCRRTHPTTNLRDPFSLVKRLVQDYYYYYYYYYYYFCCFYYPYR